MKPRPAQAPITYEINDVVGLDIFFVKNHLGVKVPCLNMVDWGSLAQIVVPLPDQESQSIRRAYRRCWKRFFGCPRLLVIDQERGFSMGEFPHAAQAEGTEVTVTSSRSPWQAGRTERAGGTWKEVFCRLCDERSLGSEDDFEEAVDAATVACNEAVRISGYSVYSRLFGRPFRLPEGAAGEDSPISLEAAAALGKEAEVTKGVFFRQLARKAFIEVDARRRWQRAFHRRSPTLQDLLREGDRIYFWGPGLDKDPQVRWRGPCLVLQVKMPGTVWCSYRGALIKTSPENTRRETPEE